MPPATRRRPPAVASIPLKVRRPALEFESANPIWTPAHLDFGYSFNGGSLTLPYLEPYLIRVMREAKERLTKQQPGLDRLDALQHDIDLFCGQEGQHYKIHSRYNAMLREHYAGIEELEAEIEADFARMLREESLEFNLGYSAGFETTGMIMAQMFFHGSVASLEGADRATADLWGWHLAEEYEHRCVAFDVYQALGGSWPSRVRMYFYQQRHLTRFGQRAAEHMRRQDEEAGRIPISARSDPRMRRLGRRRDRYALRRVAGAMLPWHDPRAHEPLPDADRLLDLVDRAA